jgi:hypothetical protein
MTIDLREGKTANVYMWYQLIGYFLLNTISSKKLFLFFLVQPLSS